MIKINLFFEQIKMEFKIIDYKELKSLGKGKNGAVSLVQDEHNNLLVLKIVKKPGGYNELVMKELDHPNILKIKHYSETEAAVLIFFDYNPNVVELFLITQKPVSDYKDIYIHKYNIAAKMIDAVMYLQSKNIVHGDIKPQNFLLDTTTFEPYLIDFDGSCEYYDETVITTKKNRSCNTRYVGGTPNYVSPYILENNRICYSVDIYSLGITLLVFLTQIKNIWGDANTAQGVYNMKKLFKIHIQDGNLYYKKSDSTFSAKVQKDIFKYSDFNAYSFSDNISYINKGVADALNLMMSNTEKECINLEEIKNAFIEAHKEVMAHLE